MRNPGQLVYDTIRPGDSEDLYATHEAKYGKGGHRSVATLAERDAISEDRREEGMTVYVEETGATYTLGSDLESWTQSDAAGVVDDALENILSGNNLTAVPEWSDVPATKYTELDAPAQALLNRTEFLSKSVRARSLLNYATQTATPSETAAAMQQLIDDTKGTGRTAVFPAGDWTINADLMIDEPLHIYCEPGFNLTSAGAGMVFSHGIGALDGARYGAGLFNFVAGAEGSFFECYGDIDVVRSNSMSQTNGAPGEPVQPSAVFIRGCNGVRVDGNFIIRRTFNGVTVVDSDNAAIDGFRMINPANGERNAGVDAEASDYGYVGERVYVGPGYEEGVDLNTLCRGWKVHIHGDTLQQFVCEVNDSIDIEVYPRSRNCECFHAFNYGTSRERWTRRERDITQYKNRNITGVCRAYYDEEYAETLDNNTFRVEHNLGGDIKFIAHVSDSVSSGPRIGRFVYINDNVDQWGGRYEWNIYSKTDLILNSVGNALVDCAGSRNNNYVSRIVHPLSAADQPFVRLGAGDATLRIEYMRQTASQQGVGVRVVGEPNNNRIIIDGVMSIFNTSIPISSNGDRVYALPYLVGNNNGRPANAAGMQPYLSTTSRGVQFYDRAAGVWDGQESQAVPHFIESSTEFAGATINNGASLTVPLGVTGAAVGQFVIASLNVDLQGVSISAYVNATNNARVVLANNTGSEVTIAAGTLRVRVYKNLP